jgi:purine nucleoside phosphorylase
MQGHDQQRPVPLGVIGGSGLYDLDGLIEVQRHQVEGPFGTVPPVQALRQAIVTHPDAIGGEATERVALLAADYLG